MKISAVSNNINNVNHPNRNSKNQSFRGLTDGMVKFWQFIDTHGRAAQFTVEDMCGTNFPRTYKGAMAGYKYTGKINWAALAQEAIREFMTGPTMCLMPVGILALVKHAFGKTSDTHIENIKNLSHIMSSLEGTTGDELDSSFISAAVKDMLSKTSGQDEVDPKAVEKLTSKILEYKKHWDLKNLSKAKAKELNIERPNGKELKEELAKITDEIQSYVKEHKDSYEGTNFLSAKYSISKNQTGSTKAANYVDYIVHYATDFKKTLKDGTSKVTANAVETFKSGWVAKRFGIIVAMVGITGLAMSYIPKIYTMASGNVNPNAKTIYSEAEKLPNDKKKEEVKA